MPEFNLVDLFSGRLQEAIKNVPQEMLDLSEVDFSEKYKPNSTDWLLRKRFQEVVNTAKATGITQITAASIYDDIVARQTFDVSVLPRPDRIAWMLRPMTNHLHVCEEIVDMGIVKIKEYLRNTKVTDKNAKEILRLVEFCMNRYYGPVIQKLAIHQKSETIQSQSTRDVVDAGTPQLLLDKLSELSDKLSKSQQNVADAEPK